MQRTRLEVFERGLSSARELIHICSVHSFIQWKAGNTKDDCALPFARKCSTDCVKMEKFLGRPVITSNEHTFERTDLSRILQRWADLKLLTPHFPFEACALAPLRAPLSALLEESS